MAKIPGGIPFGGLVAPTDDNDTYAVTDEKFNRGGYRTVQDTTERDAIPVDRRSEGMKVRCISDSTEYILNSDGSTWTAINFGEDNEGFGSHDDGVVLLGIDTNNKGTIGTNAIDSSQTTISGRGSTGDYSHAEGGNTHAEGNDSHAEGYNTHAEGFGSHAEGEDSHAEGDYSHAEGDNTHAEGENSHAEGYGSHAEGENSHAEGENTVALSTSSHAEGRNSFAGHAIKIVSVTYPTEFIMSGDVTSSFNSNLKFYVIGNSQCDIISESDFVSVTYDSGLDQTTIIVINGASSSYKYVIPNSGPSLSSQHATGFETVASGQYSYTQGSRTYAEGYGSHAEGYNTHAKGQYSHAEGSYSHAEGSYSHAEGGYSHTEGQYSHAEGENSHAEGNYSHAEGYNTHAEGPGSHAEGENSHAEGHGSHACGRLSHARDNYSTYIASGAWDNSTPGQAQLGLHSIMAYTTDASNHSMGQNSINENDNILTLSLLPNQTIKFNANVISRNSSSNSNAYSIKGIIYRDSSNAILKYHSITTEYEDDSTYSIQVVATGNALEIQVNGNSDSVLWVGRLETEEIIYDI